MPERRHEKREGSADRRSFPRPPLWLNLAILLLGVALAIGAKFHRDRLDRQFDRLVSETKGAPLEVNRIRNELAEMDLSKEALAKELEARISYLKSLKTEQFNISIDTQKGRFHLLYGNDVVRDAPVVVGPPATVQVPGGRKYTFVPLRGTTHVEGKIHEMSWHIPQWIYVMNNQPVPESRPRIKNGLGEYVILLPNNYVIHSPPAPDSPLKGAKPGSFMVPAEDLRAIWPRISENMKVYVF